MSHAQEEEEDYELLEFDNTIQRSPSPSPLEGMGCFHFLLHGIMVCVKELKTVCRNTIERRRNRRHESDNNNEENVSLLTESMEEDVDYNTTTTTTLQNNSTSTDTTTTQVSALDQAMKHFVETNDPQAFLHVFDVAIKDDKQD